VYHVLNSNQQPLAVRQFTKMLARNGLESKPTRIANGPVTRGIKVTWVATTEKLNELTETYFKPEDQALLPKKAKA
jgi:hypothetical protein